MSMRRKKGTRIMSIKKNRKRPKGHKTGKKHTKKTEKQRGRKETNRHLSRPAGASTQWSPVSGTIARMGAIRREKGWHPTSGAHPQVPSPPPTTTKKPSSPPNEPRRTEPNLCRLFRVQYDCPTQRTTCRICNKSGWPLRNLYMILHDFRVGAQSESTPGNDCKCGRP